MTAKVAMSWRGAAPDPRLGPAVELLCRQAGGLINLVGVEEALASEGITPVQAPPALLQIEPARARGDGHLLNARVVRQPLLDGAA